MLWGGVGSMQLLGLIFLVIGVCFDLDIQKILEKSIARQEAGFPGGCYSWS
ncbi:hypothetical protein SynNOUM97013_00219 [Synechococcus sp. NOUM97013]|nr:hypothetical protein SynNOUM97013_00219 [Synechococcus sp. NOUM97013]